MGIITLLLINSTISFIEENNAGNAAAALMARLAPKAKVFYQRPVNCSSIWASEFIVVMNCIHILPPTSGSRFKLI